MYIDNVTSEKIKNAAEMRMMEVIENYVKLHKKGASYVGKCPKCGSANGLSVTPKTSGTIYKCFQCGEMAGNSAIKFVMQSQEYTFPQALEDLAKILNIYIEVPEQKKQIVKKTTSKKQKKSYLDTFLEGSGLTIKDVKSTLFLNDDNHTAAYSNTFKSGTIDQYGKITSEGDDVIIEYYDLDGAPCRYEYRQKTGKIIVREYYRVRWQFPEEHLDKDGKPTRYRSPSGGGTFIYIPQAIRNMRMRGDTIDTLFVQEGEKKAEAACKAGIPSIGISGIQNLGRNGALPTDFIRIVQIFQVKAVCMVYDSDFNDISSNIKLNDRVDKRAWSFFYAARNFKEYVRSLTNRDLYVDIYIGHIKKNEANDKGIDDLLVNSLKGREWELKEDVKTLFNEKGLEGKFLKCYKITSYSDHKLEEIWGLNDAKTFAEKHKEILKRLPEFKIGKHTWKFDEEENFVSAQPFDDNEKFWIETIKTDKNGEYLRTEYEFYYVNAITFLQNKGFARYLKPDGKTWCFIKYDKPFLKEVEPFEIRDYVMQFSKDFGGKAIVNMLIRGGVQFLGPEKLSHLDFTLPIFEQTRRDAQLFYFKNFCWEVTANNIRVLDYATMQHSVWIDQKREFEVRRTQALLNVTKLSEQTEEEQAHYRIDITEQGRMCQMLTFLFNTSNFTWRKTAEEITPEELQEDSDHLMAKLCAIGYMVVTHKDKAVAKAVVAMDGKQSEVGQSNGRSGKSLLGEMFKHIMPTVSINGKGKSPAEDQFYWDGVTEKTKVVFIDDLRTNFSIEDIFPYITGDFSVNYKGGIRPIFPFSKAPKIYLTTNHAINGNGTSFSDRQWRIAFSDWYNDNRKPTDDFGNMLFDEWDDPQWNLFWNFIAECVQLYLKFGVVQAPSLRIEQRQLRQEMGENFLSWADEYFSDSNNLNVRLPRKTLYDACIEYTQDNRKFHTQTLFKRRIKNYCTWANLIFNPGKLDRETGQPYDFDKDGRPNMDDKSGGIEYFTLGTDQYWLLNADKNQHEVDPLMSPLTKMQAPDNYRSPLPFDD